MTDSNKHLLRYSFYDQMTDSYLYPFTKHDQWIHWVQNTAECHRLNGQHNVYLKKHPEDGNLTEEALRNILNEGGEVLQNILGCIQKFNANISKSNSYFYKRRKELEVLIQ